MQIIKNRALEKSEWTYLPLVEPEEDIGLDSPESTVIHNSDSHSSLMAYTKWRELDSASRKQVVGIVLMPEDNLFIKAHELSEVKVIGIVFPTFNEGRGYTQATILRNQLQYTSELRAINAYRDNLVLLEECGFDAFEITQSEDINEALSAFDELELALR